jgi:NADH-quinone oxidoreductase subunit N
MLMAELVIKRKETLAFMTILTAGLLSFTLVGSMGTTFGGMFISDGYSTFFKLIFIVNMILTVLISSRYLETLRINFGEYYSLILFSTLGMMIMASAGDIIVLYLGLELMALSTYVLAGFIRYDVRSNEAAMKYLLLGAFASAILLYGTAMIYGLTGTTNLRDIASYIAANNISGNPMLILSMVMFAVAFSFKIAAVPFHMWAPDAYEGAPTPVTAFMSVGPKAAGLSILTMAVGNIVALSQTNIKRMLAYSSIAHAGYMMVGIISGTPDSLASVLNYMLIYAFMNIGAFGVITMLRTEKFRGEDITDFEGLAKTHPMAAALMLIFMFSLTGIPPTAGFMGKFYLFMSAISAGYTWLVIVAVLFSAISAYFYLRIVMLMYMKEPRKAVELNATSGIGLALAVTAAAVLFIGIMPSMFVNMARAAVAGF